MIQSINQQFFRLKYNYDNFVVRQRAQIILLMIYILLGVWVVRLINRFLLQVEALPFANSDLIYVFATPILMFIVYRLVQAGRVQAAAYTLVGALILGTAPFALTTGNLFGGFFLLIPLLLAGVVLNWRGFLIAFAALLLVLFTRTAFLSQVDTAFRYIPSRDAVQEITLIGLLMVTSAVFLYTAIGTADRLLDTSAQDAKHLKAFTDFRIDNETELLPIATRALEIFRDELGYSLAQIYLADEAGYVSQRIRAGGVVDRQFATRIEDLPTIGEVIREKRARVFRRDVSAIQEYPLAPARVGIAAPILYQGIVIGLLDTQKRSAADISPTLLSAFESFADTLANTFINARRLTELQKTVEDQEEVIASFRTRLTELQSSSAQVVGSGWSRYLEARGSGAIGFDLDAPEGAPTALPASDLPTHIRETLARGEFFMDTEGDTRVVHVPILLRDEVLGAMTFNVPPDRPITDRQFEALRTVASRLAQSLENNRLFEQSQSQAARERKASEVSARLIGATNVESLLELAATSFNDALGAVYTRVYIEPGAVSETLTSSTSNNGAHGDDSMNGSANGSNGAHERSS